MCCVLCAVSLLPVSCAPYVASLSGIIGSYIRSWERPGDLPRVIEML